MGYRIRKVNYSIGWKLSFEKYDSNGRHFKDIPKSEWARLGFSVTMNIEESKNRAKSLNARAHLLTIEEKRTTIREKLQKEQQTISAHLNPSWVSEFENKLQLTSSSKWDSHWRAAQRLIYDLQSDVSDWVTQPELFYRYFEKHQWSLSYCQKILFMLNNWGKFVSRKQKSFFEPIPPLRGRNKERIRDESFDKIGERFSLPIRPSELETQKNNLQSNHYNWLYLSIWLGLRPEEVDLLQKESEVKRTWWTSTFHGKLVLWIYQNKLKNIARDRRVKGIPLLRPEQLLTIQIIKLKDFKRPLGKTIRKYFGAQHTCYAGRKGFVTLMRSFGYDFIHISKWMGHQDINRTWRDYTEKDEDLF